MVICYLDASKAFDKINHFILFTKLIDRNVPLIIVRLLYRWYTEQQLYVRWNHTLSEPFTVSNGVRQGGILSPHLFNVYIDELSYTLNATPAGCKLNALRVNHLLYADDVVLLAPSPSAMQILLNTCSEFARNNELKYNVKKSVSMCIKPKWLKNMVLPDLMLDNNVLQRVYSHKYIGMFLQDSLSDKNDMDRQKRGIYCRGNILVKRFGKCNPQTKVKLFKAYMSSMYCFNLWNKFTKAEYAKVKCAYNRVYRNFMCVDVTHMHQSMVESRVKSFGEIERNLNIQLQMHTRQMQQ